MIVEISNIENYKRNITYKIITATINLLLTVLFKKYSFWWRSPDKVDKEKCVSTKENKFCDNKLIFLRKYEMTNR